MTTMPAVMKTARGEGNVTLREAPRPEPGPGEVLLAVRAAGICGTDIHIWDDEFPSEPPVTMGHEVSAVVDEVGDGIDGWAPGGAREVLVAAADLERARELVDEK